MDTADALTPEPVQQPTTPTPAQTEQPTPTPPKRYILILRRLFKIAAILVLAAIGLIVIMIIWVTVGDHMGKARQKKAYQQAVNKCGKDPVVIVRRETVLFGSTTYYDLYTPNNPSYDTYKAIHNKGFLSFGDETVEGYYCSVEEARANNKYVDDDTTQNYSFDEQKQMAAKILHDYTDATGVILYQISNVSPNLELESLWVSQNTHDEYDSIYRPYEYRFALKGSDKKELKEVIFTCSSEVQVEPTINNDIVYRTDANTKKQLVPRQIQTTYQDKGTTGHSWSVNVYSGTRSDCELNDRKRLITKEEGDEMLNKLEAIDLVPIEANQLRVFLD
jgi:hypothetical protein